MQAPRLLPVGNPIQKLERPPFSDPRNRPFLEIRLERETGFEPATLSLEPRFPDRESRLGTESVLARYASSSARARNGQNSPKADSL